MFQLYRHRGARYLEMVPLKPITGPGFIAIGTWSLLERFRGQARLAPRAPHAAGSTTTVPNIFWPAWGRQR